MKKLLLSITLLVMSISITSCGPPHINDPADETRSLVFGVIEVEDRPFHWATIKQYKPKTDKPYWGAATIPSTGLFWNENLAPGKYQVIKFGGQAGNTIFTFNLGEDGENETAFTLKKGGLYFIGSFQHKRVKQKGVLKKMFVGENKFTFDKSKTPTEMEALTLLLPYSTGTVWQARIIRRIKKLGGKVDEKYLPKPKEKKKN